MPTEHWTDMRDLWTCACTSHFFADRLPRSTVVRATSRCAQLGDSYVQLHCNDLNTSSLTVNPDEPHTVAYHRNWKNVTCIRCGSSLGQAELPNKTTINEEIGIGHSHDHSIENGSKEISNGESEHQSHSHAEKDCNNLDESIDSILFRCVRFDKYRVKTEKDVFLDYNLESKVCTDLLALIGLTGIFKFTLRDYRTRTSALLLNVLGWDSLVYSPLSPSLPNSPPQTKPSPAIRLTFSVINESSSIDPLAPTEFLEYDCVSLSILKYLLEARNTSLPPSISKLGPSLVSYMHYVPPERG